jgi:hypothetical protein
MALGENVFQIQYVTPLSDTVLCLQSADGRDLCGPGWLGWRLAY